MPPPVSDGGGLVCESVGKADLLSDHLTASSPGRLLIYCSLVSKLLVLDVMAPRLSVVFRRLVRLGSFPSCSRLANVTPIPKGPPSSSVAIY